MMVDSMMCYVLLMWDIVVILLNVVVNYGIIDFLLDFLGCVVVWFWGLFIGMIV